ncbi:MAG: hypothetical protein E6Q40_11705 [Cupriavidus sp.]|nr:MAG: hypothetical protein E6Q40_11705 [Cupriavidus sp.]
MLTILRANDDHPFEGYRNLGHAATHELRRRGEFMATIEHFYQAELLRTRAPLARAELLALPGAKEAHKRGVRARAELAPAGPFEREAVMRCAIWFKMRAYPRSAISLVREFDAKTLQYPFWDEYWSRPDEAGVYPDRYVALLAKVRFSLLSKPMRVAFGGARTVINDDWVIHRLEYLFSRNPPAAIYIPAERGIGDIVERWAIARQIPVAAYVSRGAKNRVERQRRNGAMLANATHAVLIGSKDLREVQEFAAQCKTVNVPCKRIELDAAGAPTGTRTGRV